MNSDDSYLSRNEIVLQAMLTGEEMRRPSVLFRPTLSLDGNQYCALYGDNLMEGCAGFGATAQESMADFDRNWKGVGARRRGYAIAHQAVEALLTT